MSVSIAQSVRVPLGQILSDKFLWLAAAGLAAILALACLFPGGDAGRQAVPEPGGKARSARAQAMKERDPVLYAVTQGTLPGLNAQLTLEEAFARYPWFAAPATWMSRGAPDSGTVLVTARLKAPGDRARLGLGSDQAALIFVCEFGLSGDAGSFRPLHSAVEVRDASNALVSRVEDRDFTTLRRIMAGREPDAKLLPGAVGAR